MIKKKEIIMKPLGDMIQEVSSLAQECLVCGNISNDETCEICDTPKRKIGQICVVEDVADLWAMERTQSI